MNRFSCSTIRSISKFSDYFLGRFHQVFSFVEGIFLLGHFICWVAYYTHYTGWILGILIIFIISIMVHYNSYILGAYNPLLDLYSLNNQGLGFFFIAHISGGLVCVCVQNELPTDAHKSCLNCLWAYVPMWGWQCACVCKCFEECVIKDMLKHSKSSQMLEPKSCDQPHWYAVHPLVVEGTDRITTVSSNLQHTFQREKNQCRLNLWPTVISHSGEIC